MDYSQSTIAHPPGRSLRSRSISLFEISRTRCFSPTPLGEPNKSTTKMQIYKLYGGGGWIRTTEAFASDLQSDPFGHSGTPAKSDQANSDNRANQSFGHRPNLQDRACNEVAQFTLPTQPCQQHFATRFNLKMELVIGVEPTTC